VDPHETHGEPGAGNPPSPENQPTNDPSEEQGVGSRPGTETRAATRSKVLLGAVLAVVIVAILYSVNRYWIAPAVRIQAKSTGEHPLAPPFSLTDISGNKLSLNDYKGKVVMLDFWATWCGPCRIEIPGFVELQNRYGREGFAVIGISMDDGADPVVDFYRQFKMNYRVALGDDRVTELYGGVLGLPTTFLIGRDGRIYRKHVGAADPALFEQEIKELLAMQPGDPAQSFMPFGPLHPAEKIELGNPAEIDSEVPGVDLTHLSAAQKEAFKKQLEGEQCTCGCKFNLLKCRQVDRKCGVSRQLARQQLEKFLRSRA
jgi:cytochrome c biogenesis protein CcmG/thiol:disulfide interchange protein DsbE